MNRFVSSSVLVALAAVLAAPAGAAEQVHAYAGSSKCRPCHMAEYRSWASTKMAKIFELLKPGVAASAKLRSKLDPAKDYTADARCLPCHTTGYGKPGGFVDTKSTPDLVSVGCEDCHGPGAAYASLMASRKSKKADFVAAGLMSEVSKEQCTQCHSPESPIGTVVGSRHFVKRFVFSKTKGLHARPPAKLSK